MDKGGRCVGLTNLPPSCAESNEIWESQPPGTLRASPELYRDCFTFISVGYHSRSSTAEGHFFEPADELRNYLNYTMTGRRIGKEH